MIVTAQPENAAIAKGNKLYKEGKFEAITATSKHSNKILKI